jgi:hypothetical protein
MPERRERFFWLHGKRVDASVARRIEAANKNFVAQWTECPLEAVSCVTNSDSSDRLWLFRLKAPELGTAFDASLQKYIGRLPTTVKDPALKVKRQTVLPTPLIGPRLSEWPVTDIGLHVVNDQYNGMLVTYTYHVGRYHYVPHLQFPMLKELGSRVGQAWQSATCRCHEKTPECCGLGCYDCFQSDCTKCQGTGWKHFQRWASGGFAIDYSSGFPLADF